MKNLNKLDLIRIKYFCSSKAVVGSQTGPHQRGQESTKVRSRPCQIDRSGKVSKGTYIQGLSCAPAQQNFEVYI